MSKIKILYVVSTLERKGPTNQLFYLIKYLDRNKFTTQILTLSPEPKESMMTQFLTLDVKIKSLNHGRIKGVLLNKRSLNNIIVEFKPDIIQSMGLRADGLISDFSKKILCMTTSRNFPLVDYPQKFGNVKGSLMAKKHLGYFKKLNVVSCSHSIAVELESVGVSSEVIQNGVDTKMFVAVKDKSIQKAKMSLPADAKVFVVVGSLIPRKNVAEIVRAFPENSGNSLLLVVGDGPEMESLKEIATGKNVLFKGNSSQVKEYLQASDWMISASKAEGLPNAVLEALACGVPVLLSSIPAHVEIVKGTAFEDFLFSDQKTLEKLIEDLVQSDENEKLEEKALTLAQDNFSAEVMSQFYQKKYLSIS